MTDVPSRIDADTVRRVAKLARLAVTEVETASLANELEAILTYVERISAASVVDPSPAPSHLARRPDVVNEPSPRANSDGQAAVAQAPALSDRFILVPVVVSNDG